MQKNWPFVSPVAPKVTEMLRPKNALLKIEQVFKGRGWFINFINEWSLKYLSRIEKLQSYYVIYRVIMKLRHTLNSVKRTFRQYRWRFIWCRQASDMTLMLKHSKLQKSTLENIIEYEKNPLGCFCIISTF